MAIVFTDIPESGMSVFEDLVYTISGTPENMMMDVEIATGPNRLPVGAKRFKGGEPIEVNISGYLRQRLNPAPWSIIVTTVGRDNGRFVIGYVRVGNTFSQPRIFTCAMRSVDSFDVMTMLPLRRNIGWGERDEVSIMVPAATLNCKVVLSGAGIAQNERFIHESSPTKHTEGVSAMSVVMSDISRRVKTAGGDITKFDSMEVIMNADGSEVTRLYYDIVNPDKRAVRLCWLNRSGGIDFYTFGCAVAQHSKTDRSVLKTNNGFLPVGLEEEKLVEVVSGYIPESFTEGVMEVLSSPLVWQVSNDVFTPVIVERADTQSIYAGKLNSIRFFIRDKQPSKCQSF